ncbi:MAG TPA: DEAD/DEAH box helicase [Beijerinckiaceae bacterium]|nr:DEAD/DEAH box helicase [Rhodoblastus sp.]MCB1533317.1 DEAD/DEAH box helicase [Rhodoblastus sp.]MCC2108478.1 DEAD/DEAH box helicase [Hyphomicrobiales bacterium]MCO5088722.1 DEAD/DEAH box helicase [Methylobacteriaceae bacterium]HRY01530.1 DEAD/DEAH box helicase [Beijerinckiaceae bacterium]
MSLTDTIDDLLERRAAPPPMFQAPAWSPPGPTRQTWPAILQRDYDRRGSAKASAYYLQLHLKKHAPLAAALGLERIDERNYRCIAPDQIALLAAFASDALLPRIHEDFPAIEPLFRARLAASYIPAAPALEWSPITQNFVLIAGPAYSDFLEMTGWWRDPLSGFYMTFDPWLAAAYLRQATPQARQLIEASLIGPQLFNALVKQPIHGPFLVPSPDRHSLMLFAGDGPISSALCNQGVHLNADTGAYHLATVGAARPYIGLLHPSFRTIGAKITAGDALIETDGTAIADLITLVETEDMRGRGGKKKDAEPVQMTFHAASGAWRVTDAALAARAGFTPAGSGIFQTTDLDAALNLRAVADMASELAIETALADRYAAAVAAAQPPTLPAAPAGEEYSPEQIEALRFIGARPHTLIADDMGLGKSVVGAGAIEMLRPTHTLIVCMPQSIDAWVRHIEKWTLHGPAIHVARADTPVQPGVTIISDAVLARAKHLMAHHWGLAIVDEVHRFKADDSARAAAIYDPTNGIVADRTIDLSGTPIPNRPQDLFNLLHHKLPEIFPSRDTFNKLYGVEDLEKSVVDMAAARRRRALGDILRKTIMIRRLKNLPVRKTRRTVAYEIDDPTLVANLKAEQATLQRYEGAKRTVERTKILAELNRLRCETSLHKVPLVADLLADLIAQGRTPLVFGHHHVVIDRLAAELDRRGFDFGKIHGGSTSAAQRQSIVDDFQGGRHHGLIAGIKSGGTSLTITRADCVVFIEIDWTPYDLVQAEDRAYRRGQTRDVLVLYVVIRNSVDSHVASVNNLKIRIASEILDPLPEDIADLQTIAA